MTAQGFDLDRDYELPDRDYRTMNRLAGRLEDRFRLRL